MSETRNPAPRAGGGRAHGNDFRAIVSHEYPASHHTRQRTYSTTRRRALVIIDSGRMPHDGGRRVWWVQVIHPSGLAEVDADASSLREARRIAWKWQAQGYLLVERDPGGAP